MELEKSLDALRAMPSFVAGVVHRLSHDESRLPGPGGSFSLVEHIWHLADLEREGFGERIQRLRVEPSSFLPDFDGDRIARERDYAQRDCRKGVAAFRTSREDNLRILRGLSEDEWNRSGFLERVGAVLLRDIPVLMLEHDLSHRAEIERLLGR